MDLVQRLCRAFEKHGLKFFKEGKKTTYVARLRPRQITNEERFSDGIRKIVAYVRAHPNTKLNDLAGALIPESKRSAPPVAKKKEPKRRKQKRRPARSQQTSSSLPGRAHSPSGHPQDKNRHPAEGTGRGFPNRRPSPRPARSPFGQLHTDRLRRRRRSRLHRNHLLPLRSHLRKSRCSKICAG